MKVFLRQLNIRPRGDGHNRDSIKLPNGSRLIALPASEATTRGFSALAMLIIEEASRVPNSEYQALRPMLATSNGSVILLSRPNGRRGFFHDVWTTPGATWTRIFAPSTECPRISQEFLDLELRNQPGKWFRQEYLCEFLNDAESYFSYEKVKACFTESVPAQAEEVFYGLDLGKERNHAALARIDRVELVSETLNRTTWERQTSWSYRLTALDRFPLGTTYTEVVQSVHETLRRARVAEPNTQRCLVPFKRSTR